MGRGIDYWGDKYLAFPAYSNAYAMREQLSDDAAQIGAIRRMAEQEGAPKAVLGKFKHANSKTLDAMLALQDAMKAYILWVDKRKG